MSSTGWSMSSRPCSTGSWPEDFPFLGACYGVGTLGRHQGAVIDRTYGEGLGGVTIKLTDEGLADPLLRGLPESFTAFTGHKEACTAAPLPRRAPGQLRRLPGAHVPDQEQPVRHPVPPRAGCEGLVTRIDIYRHAGYFPPESAEMLMEDARRFTATEPMKILRNFVERYAR